MDDRHGQLSEISDTARDFGQLQTIVMFDGPEDDFRHGRAEVHHPTAGMGSTWARGADARPHPQQADTTTGAKATWNLNQYPGFLCAQVSACPALPLCNDPATISGVVA